MTIEGFGCIVALARTNTEEMNLDPKYGLKILLNTFEKFDKLRKERKYCDIVFVGCNGCELYAHKIILSSVTEFFDVSCNFKAENDEITRIKLEDLDIEKSVFETILEIVYMKNPTINLIEAVDILFAADKLLMNRVIKYVETIIVEKDDLDHCLSNAECCVKLCQLPSLEQCPELISRIESIFSIFLYDVTMSPGFYEIPVKLLCLLNVFKYAEPFRYPEICVDFIVKWLMYDIDNRIADIRAIVEYLNSNPGPGRNIIDSDAVDTFLATIAEVRRENSRNPDTFINVLRFSLRGLLSESIRVCWSNIYEHDLTESKQDLEDRFRHLSDWPRCSNDARNMECDL